MLGILDGKSLNAFLIPERSGVLRIRITYYEMVANESREITDLADLR